MKFDLPAMQVFPSSAPRYPNVWFFVHASLCDTYREAQLLVWRGLEESADIYNDFGIFHSAEGSDAFARRRGLQPIRLGERGERSHDHSLHVRFYFSALKQNQPVAVEAEPYYRMAGSVHYEVDRPRAMHPYDDECPLCGCTGAYAAFAGSSIAVKNESVHDPLGLEALLYGTIRGERLIACDGVDAWRQRYEVDVVEVAPYRSDMNTSRIGAVFVRAKI